MERKVQDKLLSYHWGLPVLEKTYSLHQNGLKTQCSSRQGRLVGRVADSLRRSRFCSQHQCQLVECPWERLDPLRCLSSPLSKVVIMIPCPTFEKCWVVLFHLCSSREQKT